VVNNPIFVTSALATGGVNPKISASVTTYVPPQHREIRFEAEENRDSNMANSQLVEILKPISEVAKRPVETACNLIESLLGEPFKIAGSAIADQVVFWQWRNRIAIFEKFDRIRQQRKLAIHVLPPEFLLPLIRECGDTSDEKLQDAWARLLAAAIEHESNQHIGFIQVLSGISSTDAKVLTAIVQACPGIGEDKLDKKLRTVALAEKLNMPTSAIALSLSNLQRLGFFNPPQTKFSAFAVSFLRVCLTSSEDLNLYLEEERKIKALLLFG
jgi:hypothetical protein